MKTFLTAAICGLLVSSSSAFAACTQTDLAKKGADLEKAAAAYTQRNPDKAADLNAKLEAIGNKIQAGVKLDELCKAYDELISSLK